SPSKTSTVTAVEESGRALRATLTTRGSRTCAVATPAVREARRKDREIRKVGTGLGRALTFGGSMRRVKSCPQSGRRRCETLKVIGRKLPPRAWREFAEIQFAEAFPVETEDGPALGREHTTDLMIFPL